MYFEPIDDRGRPITVGDWVRLVTIPPDVATAPEETQAVFAAALGRTFRVEAFNEYGLAELDLTRKVARLNTIWVEPPYLRRTRRPARR
jgi:hypothetical protein